MKKYYYILLGCFLLGNMPVNAQQIWKLEDCIKKAWQENFRMKQAQLNTHSNQLDVNQARAQMLPSINGSGTQAFNLGRNVDPFTNTFSNQTIRSNNFTLQANWTLFNGFQVQNTIKREQYDLQAWQADEKTAKNDIALQVAGQYLQILMNRELVFTSQKQLELSQLQAARLQKLMEAGKVSEAEYLMQQSQVANDELNLINAKSNLQMAYLSLWQSMNMEPDTANTIEAPPALIPMRSTPRSAKEIFDAVFQNRPEIQSANYKLSQAQMQQKISEGSRLPRLNMFANVSSLFSSTRKDITGFNFNGYNIIGITKQTFDTVVSPKYDYVTKTTPFGHQLSNNFGQSFGFSLSIPIFNNLQAHTAVQKSKIQSQLAQVNLDMAKMSLYKNIQQAVIDLQVAETKYDAAQKNFAAQQKAFQASKIRYDNGAATLTEYQLANTNYTRAESNYLQSRYELIFRQKIIDFYMGNELKF